MSQFSAILRLNTWLIAPLRAIALLPLPVVAEYGLRVDREEAKVSVFQGQESLRMATHCRRPKPCDPYSLQEMMAL
jgi:hypothetical protein